MEDYVLLSIKKKNKDTNLKIIYNNENAVVNPIESIESVSSGNNIVFELNKSQPVDHSTHIITIIIVHNQFYRNKVNGYTHWTHQISFINKRSHIESMSFEYDENFKFKKLIRLKIKDKYNIEKNNIDKIKLVDTINNNHIYVCFIKDKNKLPRIPNDLQINSQYKDEYWKYFIKLVPQSYTEDNIQDFYKLDNKTVPLKIDRNISIDLSKVFTNY